MALSNVEQDLGEDREDNRYEPEIGENDSGDDSYPIDEV